MDLHRSNAAGVSAVPSRVTSLKPIVMRLVVAGLLLAITSTASASQGIRECGGYDPGYGFVSGDPMGAGVYNITTRVVSCRTARKVVRRYYVENWCGRSLSCYVGAWNCRTRILGSEYLDTRCTRSRGRVVRFQHGA